MAGFFMLYSKPALSFSEQTTLLQSRGLVIANPVAAEAFLKRVSYYRLSAYYRPFQKTKDVFNPGTTFEQIVHLYDFDRKLRMIVMDGIERVEVALRTSITYAIAATYGPFGHMHPGNFTAEFDHAEFMKHLTEEEERCREVFVQHYRNKYIGEKHLPIWIASELLPFGSMSKMFRHLKDGLAYSIAKNDFGMPHRVFRSWLHTLTVVRNMCAHHRRLWNRELGVRPIGLPNGTSQERLYGVLVLMSILIDRISPGCGWKQSVVKLKNDHPSINFGLMHAPEGWEKIKGWTS
jgi:abortive infection bacteriophage resistance protein